MAIDSDVISERLPNFAEAIAAEADYIGLSRSNTAWNPDFTLDTEAKLARQLELEQRKKAYISSLQDGIEAIWQSTEAGGLTVPEATVASAVMGIVRNLYDVPQRLQTATEGVIRITRALAHLTLPEGNIVMADGHLYRSLGASGIKLLGARGKQDVAPRSTRQIFVEYPGDFRTTIGGKGPAFPIIETARDEPHVVEVFKGIYDLSNPLRDVKNWDPSHEPHNSITDLGSAEEPADIDLTHLSSHERFQVRHEAHALKADWLNIPPPSPEFADALEQAFIDVYVDVVSGVTPRDQVQQLSVRSGQFASDIHMVTLRKRSLIEHKPAEVAAIFDAAGLSIGGLIGNMRAAIGRLHQGGVGDNFRARIAEDNMPVFIATLGKV